MDIQIYEYLVIWIYEYMIYGYMDIYLSLETLETHDIYDTPALGKLTVTESVSDTPGTRDATHLKRTV